MVKSYLFTSALDYEKCKPSVLCEPDVYTLDLEDSVSDNLKERARLNLEIFFRDKKEYQVAVRINGIRSENGLKDIFSIIKGSYFPSIIFLSKTEEAEEVLILRSILEDKGLKIKIYPLIENVRSILNIKKLSEVSDGFLFGSADYAASARFQMNDENLLFAKYRLLEAASLRKIPCIECTSFEIRDLSVVKKSAEKAKEMGFTGMAAIHPRQVSIINDVFRMKEKELVNAKRTLDQFRKYSKFGIDNNGFVVAPPFAKMAVNVLTSEE